jgi:hypothetical protein
MFSLAVVVFSSVVTCLSADSTLSQSLWTLDQLRLYNPLKGMVITIPWTATFHLSRNNGASQSKSSISLSCGGEYMADETGPWYGCNRWLGMPEGEDSYSSRQKTLLKWRVRDVIEDERRGKYIFQQATLEVVQVFLQPAYAIGQCQVSHRVKTNFA